MWIKIDDKAVMDFKNKLQSGEVERGVDAAIKLTSKKIKKIIKDDVPEHYEGGKNWIGSAVQSPQTGFMQAVVPIKGNRGVIGQQFQTGGGAYVTNAGGAYGFTSGGGYKKLQFKKGAKITAKILKGKLSKLPDRMTHQGGNPPFMYKGLVYTRRTNESFPIVRVVGLAVPQMVENRAKEDIMRDIEKDLEQNIVDEVTKRIK